MAMVEELDQADERFAAFHARFAPFFFRSQVRERSRRYLHALLGPVERKNGWQLAEAMGEGDPNGAQRLLFEAVWDEEAVRDELERFVAAQFGDPEQGIFVLDETSFPKKGTKSVGVKRQYCGTLGKKENCQVGVFLTYVSPRGHVFLDRRLYLPEDWAADEARRREAGVPKAIAFQTKPALGRAMLAHAWTLGVQGAWLTGDEVYGSDSTLRRQAEERPQAYVLAVRANEAIWRWSDEEAPRQERVAAVVSHLASADWIRLSAGAGSKGPRWYDWAWLPLPHEVRPGWRRWLVARRSLEDPTELAYYFAFAPAATTLQTLVQVAGARWSVEQCLEEAKGETGLDQYQVRGWRSWHRHITLVLLAHACLAWLRRTSHERGEKGRPGAGAPLSPGGAATVGGKPAPTATLSSGALGLVSVAASASAPGTVLALSPTWRPLSFTASDNSQLRL
jgi:SRSO17 transposase